VQLTPCRFANASKDAMVQTDWLFGLKRFPRPIPCGDAAVKSVRWLPCLHFIQQRQNLLDEFDG
jgi:hypothetical protein